MRGTIVRGGLIVLIAWSLITTSKPELAHAEEGIPAGSEAVITAGQPLLVRVAPGWDAAVSYEMDAESSVTIWDVAQMAPDGSLWYPIDGGFVPIDGVTSVSTLAGEGALYEGVSAEDGGVDPTTGKGIASALVAAEPWVEPAVTDGAVVLEQRRRGKNRDTNDMGGDQIATFAMEYVGYPYVYAGEGPNAFDCSGFTKFVIQNTLGIDISHDMATQIDMGTPVERNELQPGDLVFFADTFEPGLSHNGIYIGDGQFVHAENETTGIVVSDLRAEYYRSRWYGAVRFR